MDRLKLKEEVYLAGTFTQIRLNIHYGSITRLQVPFYKTLIRDKNCLNVNLNSGLIFINNILMIFVLRR